MHIYLFIVIHPEKLEELIAAVRDLGDFILKLLTPQHQLKGQNAESEKAELILSSFTNVTTNVPSTKIQNVA